MCIRDRRYTCATVSYLILLEFAKSHRINIVEKIERPKLIEDRGRLILTLNSIQQLTIVPDRNNQGSCGGSSANSGMCLLSLLNKCSTAVGKRKFRHQLLNPITNVEELECSYNKIDGVRSNKKYKDVKTILNQIFDLERLNRRLTLNIITPNEFYNLHKSNLAITNLIPLLSDSGLAMPSLTETRFGEYMSFYTGFILPDEMLKYNIGNISRTIFVSGRFPEIDDLDREIDEMEARLNEFNRQLSLSLIHI